MTPDARVELLRMLATRLERLSVDSGEDASPELWDLLIERSFEILRNAAREIPDAEEQWRKLRAR